MLSPVTRSSTRSSTARTQGGPGPALAALGTVAVLVIGGIVVFGMLNPRQDPSAAASQAAAAASAEDEPAGDPFAGLPLDVPPVRGGEPVERDEATPAALASGDSGWSLTMTRAGEAQAALDRAIELRNGGDPASYREQAKAAKRLYEETLALAREVSERLADELGPEHPDYQYIERQRARWLDKLVALKKTTGL